MFPFDEKLKEFWLYDFFEYSEEMQDEQQDEVPSFSRIYQNRTVVSSSHNTVESMGLSDTHSEVLALRKAQNALKSRYLMDCVLFTTLEPCLMCTGAIIQARIGAVFYFAENRMGEGISSLAFANIYTKNFFPYLELISDVEVTQRWKEFFHRKRS
ncbi:MAG: nucleoside deaminase [Spirochaetota bacterium]